MKDIDLSFRRSAVSGIAIKEGTPAIIQQLNDAVKTRFGEVLYEPESGSFIIQYIKPNRSIFNIISLRDELYNVLSSLKNIIVYKGNIDIRTDEATKSYIATLVLKDIETDSNVSANFVFNFN